MSRTGAVVGIDFGTTNIKAASFSLEGKLLQLIKVPTQSVINQMTGFYSASAVSSTIEKLLEKLGESFHFELIAVTGMSEAGLLISPDGIPLTDIIPWYDPCTVPLAEKYAFHSEAGFYQTGLRNSFKFGAYKCRYFSDRIRIPDGSYWLSACDYVSFLLTGEICTDPTFAARTYLYHLSQKSFSAERMAFFRIDSVRFPAIIPSGQACGSLRGIANQDRVPVAISGHDHLCATYAMLYSQQYGQQFICNSMGTAETFTGIRPFNELSASDYHSGLNFGPFVKSDKQYWMANFPSLGSSVSNALDDLHHPSDYSFVDSSLANANDVPCNAIYFPFAHGTGTPFYVEKDISGFYGNPPTNPAEKLNAVINGICLQERFLLSQCTTGSSPLLCSGGPVNSAAWMQRKADILQREIHCPDFREATLYGALKLALEVNGSSDWHITAGFTDYYPNSSHSEFWNKQFDIYQSLLIKRIKRIKGENDEYRN